MAEERAIERALRHYRSWQYGLRVGDAEYAADEERLYRMAVINGGLDSNAAADYCRKMGRC
jgi:hypothetical protein